VIEILSGLEHVTTKIFERNQKVCQIAAQLLLSCAMKPLRLQMVTLSLQKTDANEPSVTVLGDVCMSWGMMETVSSHYQAQFLPYDKSG
jgi:hypothetical protein